MDKRSLKKLIGFGIAGNFAHHLEQAGEASDFINVEVDEVNAPKGIFPFYLPNFNTFLGTYPLSSTKLKVSNLDNYNIQMEPEVALICNIEYNNNTVNNIIPLKFGAYNDCSIRVDGAKKISQKKNWGDESKGLSAKLIDIDSFTYGGIMDSYHIASFLKRDGIIYLYGEDSAVITYNYFYEKLLQWIINKLNRQKDSDPLEDLSLYLKECDYPTQMIISIGATSYTPFGESTFLKSGDEIFIYVYDSSKYSLEFIVSHVESTKQDDLSDCSLLHQIVY